MPAFIVDTVNSIGIPRIFLLFIIFSFIGWVCEVLYVGILTEHRFVNRGFLYGPICPIYGVGALLLVFLPTGFKQTYLHLFFSAMIFCTIIEYITSWIMEKIFHARWWDYSKIPLNINGRVCLLNTVLFGVLGIVAVKYIQPTFKGLLFLFSDTVATYSAFILFVIFCIDFLMTVHRLVNFNEVLARLKEFTESLKERYTGEDWFNTENISEMLKSVAERAKTGKTKFTAVLLEKVESSLHFQGNVRQLINRFPTIRSTKYPAAVSYIHNRIKSEIEERRRNKRNVK